MEEFLTKRNTVSDLEKILYKDIPLLDHGFIRLIDYMGDDGSIVQAARVSYGKGTKKVNQDRGLIRYLLRHRHTTPFEMCEIKLHIKLPIFVARQWIRHRTANINEYSARYSILSREFYIPRKEHISEQSIDNKQGRQEKGLSDQHANYVIQCLTDDASRCYENYIDMINEHEDGSGLKIDENKPSIARELARINLTLNYYTEFYWKIDLHNLLHFLELRSHSHSQYEIRVYADAIINNILKFWVPIVYEAFLEYRLNALHLSATAVKVLKRMIEGEIISQENSGLTKREWNEFELHFRQK